MYDCRRSTTGMTSVSTSSGSSASSPRVMAPSSSRVCQSAMRENVEPIVRTSAGSIDGSSSCRSTSSSTSRRASTSARVNIAWSSPASANPSARHSA